MRRGLATAALAAGLASCAAPAPPPPEPVTRSQIGGSLPGPSPTVLLPACGGRPEAGWARAGVRDLVDVVSHAGVCQTSLISYQLRNRSAYLQGLDQLATEPGACGGDARHLQSRLARWEASLVHAVEVLEEACGTRALGEDVRAAADLGRRQTALVRDRIDRDFPELRRVAAR